jgi:hypothetical protein
MFVSNIFRTERKREERICKKRSLKNEVKKKKKEEEKWERG